MYTEGLGCLAGPNDSSQRSEDKYVISHSIHTFIFLFTDLHGRYGGLCGCAVQRGDGVMYEEGETLFLAWGGGCGLCGCANYSEEGRAIESYF